MKEKVRVMCRTWFCPVCYEKELPHKGVIFALFGTDNGCFFVHKATQNGLRGYTPHIIMYEGISDETHKDILVCCSLHKCGLFIRESQDVEYPYDVDIQKVTIHKITHADYKALEDFKDTTYWLI